jgi:hypothetical protein
VSFWGKLRAKMLIPIILALCASFVRFCRELYFLRLEHRLSLLEVKSVIQAVIIQKFLTSLDKIVLILYTTIISNLISPFDCFKSAGNFSVLSSDPSLVCWDESWKAHLPEVFVFIALYILLFPMRILYILCKIGRKKGVIQDPEYSHLVSGFQEKFFWWDMVLLLKRLMFVVISRYVLSNSDSSWKTLFSA